MLRLSNISQKHEINLWACLTQNKENTKCFEATINELSLIAHEEFLLVD